MEDHAHTWVLTEPKPVAGRWQYACECGATRDRPVALTARKGAFLGTLISDPKATWAVLSKNGPDHVRKKRKKRE